MFFALYFSFHLYIQRERDGIQENNLFYSQKQGEKKKKKPTTDQVN